MAERKLLGENLPLEDRIVLAQMTQQPGWQVLVKMMAEACRTATEAVIKLEPGSERYQERLAGLQSTARAMNKFSAELLDSVKVHKRNVVQRVTSEQNPEEQPTRFKGFKPPAPEKQSPPEGEQSNQS